MEENDLKKNQKDESQEQEQAVPETETEKDTISKEMLAKLEDAEKQAAQYKDLFVRKAAEFENFKKRTEQELGSIARFANEDLLRAFLPVVDDLERSLKNARASNDDAFYKGIELILQKTLKFMENQGVKPFETVGKEFDVHYHDAMLQMAKEGVPPHIILEEVDKGYMFHDKVLRHAKVIVSAPGTTEQPAQVEPSQEDDPKKE